LFANEMLAGNRSIFEKAIINFDELRFPIRQLSGLLRDPLDWGTYTHEDLENFCKKVPIPRREVRVSDAGEGAVTNG
jgi:hypothetical protein